MSDAHLQVSCRGGRSSGTRERTLWCVGERTLSIAARFETGGSVGLACYRRLCTSKPNAYGERETPESDSDSKSRRLQARKYLEGTPEGTNNSNMVHNCCDYLINGSLFMLVERVGGNYHEEHGYKLASAKGRKTSKGLGWYQPTWVFPKHCAQRQGPWVKEPPEGGRRRSESNEPCREQTSSALERESACTRKREGSALPGAPRTSVRVLAHWCASTRGAAAQRGFVRSKKIAQRSCTDFHKGRDSIGSKACGQYRALARWRASARAKLHAGSFGGDSADLSMMVYQSCLPCARPSAHDSDSKPEGRAHRSGAASKTARQSCAEYNLAQQTSANSNNGLQRDIAETRYTIGQIGLLSAQPVQHIRGTWRVPQWNRTQLRWAKSEIMRKHEGMAQQSCATSSSPNGSHLMTLPQPQLKGTSVSSTRGGLNKLAELKRHRDGKYRHLIEIIADPLTLLAAYGHLKVNHESWTPGAAGEIYEPFGSEHFTFCSTGHTTPPTCIVDSIEREWFDLAAKRLIQGNYECKPARRVMISKPNTLSDKITLTVLSPRDKIVQEAVRLVLNYIYNGTFESFSHGFREGRGCHSALKEIQRTWNGVSWFLEFEIRKRDDILSRRILVNILREDIQDQRFFNLIHNMFNTKIVNVELAGPSSKIGVPQGSVLSPLFCNLYLSKLDQEVKRIQADYNTPKRTRRENLEFRNSTRVTLDEKRQLNFNRDQIRRLLKKRIRRAYQKGLSKTDYNDHNFIRIFYARYADHFLFGVIGSKLIVKKVQNRISQFLQSSLHLEVTKTAITHSTAGMVNFLGMSLRCISPKYWPWRLREAAQRQRLRLKTQSLLRQKSWEASVRRGAVRKWAEAFYKTRKLIGSTTSAKRAAFSKAFELAQRLTTLNSSASDLDGSLVSELLKAEKALFSSTVWSELPEEIKRKHAELIFAIERHSNSIDQKLTKAGRRSEAAPLPPSGAPGSHRLGRARSDTIAVDPSKRRPPRVLAPIHHIREKLRRRGIVEDRKFRPTPLKLLLTQEDSVIVKYFRAIADGLLNYYRCCDNFYKVKAITNYQIRWSALHTLANKHKLTINKAIDRYTLDLIVKQEMNGQVRVVAKFPSKHEIAIMGKKFLVNADVQRYSLEKVLGSLKQSSKG